MAVNQTLWNILRDKQDEFTAKSEFAPPVVKRLFSFSFRPNHEGTVRSPPSTQTASQSEPSVKETLFSFSRSSCDDLISNAKVKLAFCDLMEAAQPALHVFILIKVMLSVPGQVSLHLVSWGDVLYLKLQNSSFPLMSSINRNARN